MSIARGQGDPYSVLKRLAVHLVGQQRPGMYEVLQRLAVVVLAPAQAFAERVKSSFKTATVAARSEEPLPACGLSLQLVNFAAFTQSLLDIQIIRQ